jgi:hypothetical protein
MLEEKEQATAAEKETANMEETAAKTEEAEGTKSSEAKARKEPEETDDIEGVVKLAKPYVFEGKEYDEIDLRGIQKLTVNDAIDAQAGLIGKGEMAAALITERSTAFAREIAQRGTGLPIEFFKYMPRGVWKKTQKAVLSMLSYDKDTEGHVMEFEEPYSYEGVVYTKIDLNGLYDLTCLNESEAENKLTSRGILITEPTYNYYYACILASMATGRPEEFYTGLPIKETLKLKVAVNDSDFFE